MKTVISPDTPEKGKPRVRDVLAQAMSQETDPHILLSLRLKYTHLRKLKRLNTISNPKQWHQPALCDSHSDLTSRGLRRLVWKVLYWHQSGELTRPLVVSKARKHRPPWPEVSWRLRKNWMLLPGVFWEGWEEDPFQRCVPGAGATRGTRLLCKVLAISSLSGKFGTDGRSTVRPCCHAAARADNCSKQEPWGRTNGTPWQIWPSPQQGMELSTLLLLFSASLHTTRNRSLVQHVGRKGWTAQPWCEGFRGEERNLQNM